VHTCPEPQVRGVQVYGLRPTQPSPPYTCTSTHTCPKPQVRGVQVSRPHPPDHTAPAVGAGEDGVDAWLDKKKLLPKQDWELEIRKAVREADVVMVCLSK